MSTTTLPIVTDATIDAAITPGTGLVAVEFSADWCAPCHLMASAVEAVAQEYAPALRVLQVDADANPRTVARFGVRGLPTMLLFRDGTLVDRIVGAVGKPALAGRIERALAESRP